MAEYFKKGSVITAYQWLGHARSLDTFLGHDHSFFARDSRKTLLVRTCRGWAEIRRGDWLFRDDNGDLDGMSSKDFEEEYIEVGEALLRSMA